MSHDNKNPNLNWLHQFPDLAKITDAAWLEAAQDIKTSIIPCGTVLFRPGDPCVNLVLVRAGTVRVYIPNVSGREIVLYRVNSGELCIFTLSNLLGKLAYSAEGITQTETQLMTIPIQRFEHALTTSSAFRELIFCTMGRRLSQVMMLMEEITFKPLDVRLAQLLVSDTSDNGSRLLKKTHQDIAGELGSSREVISRLLKKFERSGWLRLDRGYIHVISPTDLECLAHSAG